MNVVDTRIGDSRERTRMATVVYLTAAVSCMFALSCRDEPQEKSPAGTAVVASESNATLDSKHAQQILKNLESKQYERLNPAATGNVLSARQLLTDGGPLDAITIGAQIETSHRLLVVTLVESRRRRSHLVIIFPTPQDDEYVVARHPLPSYWAVNTLDGVRIWFRWAEMESLLARATRKDGYLTIEGLISDSDGTHIGLPRGVPMAIGFQYSDGRYTNFVPVDMYDVNDVLERLDTRREMEGRQEESQDNGGG